MRLWIVIALMLTMIHEVIAQPQMMTREQAAQIALRFTQAGRYPGTLHWLTTNDLPAGIEVHMRNYALREKLFHEGKDWAVTMDDMPETWLGGGDLYLTSYVFLATFDRWPDRSAVVQVNAYTGYTEVETYRESGETNDELGYGHLPVKPFEELRSIALNIAEQLLGPGTFKVVDEWPYDLSNPEHYELASKGAVLFLIFKQDQSTGALLPQMIKIILNTRTGEMEMGEYENLPVTISTVPNITRKEAQQIVAKELAQLGYEVVDWLPDGYYTGQIIYGTGFGRDAIVGLLVTHGPFLDQYLVWAFIFAYREIGSKEITGGMVMVDAHTGEVHWGYSTAIHLGMSAKPHSKDLEGAVEGVVINGRAIYPFSKAFLVNGRVYVPVKWLSGLGVRWDGTKLVGRYMAQVVKDKLIRKGQLYLPLRTICEVSGIRLWWDNRRKVPFLRVEWLEPKKLLSQSYKTQYRSFEDTRKNWYIGLLTAFCLFILLVVGRLGIIRMRRKTV